MASKTISFSVLSAYICFFIAALPCYDLLILFFKFFTSVVSNRQLSVREGIFIYIMEWGSELS